MIRFCDKEAVGCTIEEIEAMSRLEIMSFFIKNGTLLVLVVFEDDGSFYGFITYENVLKHQEQKDYLVTTKLYLSENFWEEATECLEHGTEWMLPVCNQQNEILGFCYSEKDWDDKMIYDNLDYLEEHLDSALFIKEIWPKVQQVCIQDCNEWAYRIYKLCLRKEIPVCLIGEKWEWFGYATCEGIYDYPEYVKFYIYAEGTKATREENEFLEKHRWGSTKEGFSFLTNIRKKNMADIRYHKERLWREKGIQVCNVIMPDDAQVTNKTKMELERAGLHWGLECYVNDNECLTVPARKSLEKLYGKETCEYFKKIGSVVDFADKKYLGENAMYYVSERLYAKRIYVIGPCIVAQRGVQTRENLISRLQALVEKARYTVVGCILPSGSLYWDNILEQIPIRNSDIVIFINKDSTFDEKTKKEFPCLPTLELFEQESREDWYEDEPIHINAKGTKVLADYIYSEYLEEEIQKKLQLDEQEAFQVLQQGNIVTDEQMKKIEEYIPSIQNPQIQEGMNVGSIVMNCNPFTLGHQYLIETAAKKVDYLYIFVVQENRSVYSFEDRMEMVKRGTQHLSNVVVVPSGEMILSFETMPIYFEKQQKQEAIVDATMDLEIFGQYIAPKLHIKHRFVGEEPLDKVTQQYNEQMKEVLSQYGITVTEIPRKEMDDKVISASLFRQLLEDGRYEECKAFVPETTWETVSKK